MVGGKTKMNLKQKLNYYIETLSKIIKIDQVILFGSYARGDSHEYSDIDLAVISSDLDSKKPYFVYNIELVDKATLYDPDLQLFAFPKETFEKELGIEGSFIREIKKTGKVIYQRPD